MAMIDRIEELREDKEEWSQYAERLGHFSKALLLLRSLVKLILLLYPML